MLPVLAAALWALASATGATGASLDAGSSGVQVLSPGRVAPLADAGTSLTTPVDGRLRGPDFSARVTGVAWPAVAGTGPSPYVAGTGHRLVVFSLSLSQPRSGLGPFASTDTTATAAVSTSEEASTPVDLSSIDNQIYSASQGSAMGTGTGTFVASVPASTHNVDLVITEGSFSQPYSLWTLRRHAPYPSILYRDPTTPTVSATELTGATISVTNPADGFASPAAVNLEQAVLTAFSPGGTNAAQPSSNEAYLAVTFRSRYPALGNGDPNWGHFLAGITPLPGSALTFTAPGQPPAAATAANVTAPSDQDTSSNDDGLLDATYVFTVPATTTNGTLAIAPGPTSGVEFTGFVGGSPVPLDVGGPTSFPLIFEDIHPASIAAQPKPPWVGAPLPPTGSDAASSRGLASRVPSGPGGGLSIWLAVIIVALLVVAAVVIRQVLRRRRGTEQPPPDHTSPKSIEASAGHFVASVVDDDVAPADGSKPGAVVAPVGGPTRPTPSIDTRPDTPLSPPVLPTVDGQQVVSVLGPIHIIDWDDARYRPVTKELCCYLALHNDHLLTTDQILVAVWPVESDRPEATRKTLHNYLSRLRQAVGPEHLPDAASAGGYHLVDVTTDWRQFRNLVDEAEAAARTGNAADANRFRAEALSLVRGIPFQGVPSGHYRWVFAESWATDMTAAIVDCAHHLFSDLMGSGDVAGATAAARAGLRASPKEELLWVDIAAVTIATEDGDHIRRLWRDVAGALGQDAADRIQHRVGA